jgi:hypothetical protein
VAPVRQDARAEAGERGGDPDRRNGVTQVVLAVSKRAFAVLPRLAPVDRRQRDEKQPFRPFQVERAALLERVAVGGVVIDALIQARSRYDVGFSRVQIAARRVDPQRPSRLAKLLPRGESERVAQDIADDGNQRVRPR